MNGCGWLTCNRCRIDMRMCLSSSDGAIREGDYFVLPQVEKKEYEIHKNSPLFLSPLIYLE